MGNFKDNLLIDIVATFLSVVCIAYIFESIGGSGQFNFFRIVIDSIFGFFIYASIFVLLNRKFQSVKFSKIIYSIILGSSIWVIYKMIKIVLIDWDFITNNPDHLYKRHIIPGVKAYLIFVPIFSLIVLTFIASLRKLKHIAYNSLK